MDEIKKHMRLTFVNIAVRFGLVKTKLKLSLIFSQPELLGLNFFTRGLCVTLCGLAIYIKKYLKGKRRIMEIQIFHHAKI
jgi:hypothetical protein